MKQINKDNLDPWRRDVCEDNVKFQLFDNVHCQPKYLVIVSYSLEFTVYAYN